MSSPVYIVQIGKDEALAALLAEQAGGTFQFMAVADITMAPAHADVMVFVDNAPGLATPTDSLCFRITNAQDTSPHVDEHVFIRPFRLAQFLDMALSHATLRRKKQPRPLNEGYDLHPFARIIVELRTHRHLVLTERETRLLCAVFDAGTSGLQRKDAMTQLWDCHPDVDSHAVDTTVYRLRQKLQEFGELDAFLIHEGGAYKWKTD